MVSSNFWFTLWYLQTSDSLYGIFKLLIHPMVSSNFWFTLWYLQTYLVVHSIFSRNNNNCCLMPCQQYLANIHIIFNSKLSSLCIHSFALPLYMVFESQLINYYMGILFLLWYFWKMFCMTIYSKLQFVRNHMVAIINCLINADSPSKMN
jgi:hypothetical protein